MALRGYYVYPTHIIESEIIENTVNNNNKGKIVQTNIISTISFYYKDKKKEETDKKELVFVINKFFNLINPYAKYQGEYFAFMVIRIIHDFNELEKNDAMIGYSQNPFYSTFLYNKLKTETDLILLNGREWKLSIILGPFILQKNCVEACKAWVRGTRGITSKQFRALELQKEYGVNYFTSDFLNVDYLEHLVQKLPKKYHETFNELKKGK
jgi:hypothetical protein